MVYVDLVIKAENIGTNPFTDAYLTSYLMYDDARKDMQFKMENKSSTAFESGSIPVGESRIIHMITLLPEEAKNQALTVTYKHGKEVGEHKVTSQPNISVRGDKTRLSVGEKKKIDGDYTFEILEVDVKKYYGASNVAETKQYYYSSQMFSGIGTSDEDPVEAFYVRIKVKNHTDAPLTELYAYSVTPDGKIAKADVKIETHDNTDLTNLSSSTPVYADKDGTILLVLPHVNSDSIMRFNVGNTCFYVQKY